VFAGWVNRRQLEVLEYLQEENRVVREQLGGFRDGTQVRALRRDLEAHECRRRRGPRGMPR
jgi:hypothetical protein